jgi:hypothetical protein
LKAEEIKTPKLSQLPQRTKFDEYNAPNAMRKEN